MSLEICKLSRNSLSKICKEQTYAYPDKNIVRLIVQYTMLISFMQFVL